MKIYVSRTDGDAVEHGERRSRLAAEELTREGMPIRLLRSIFVREDETCLFLYEAVSADAVREVARRAALPYERITEATAELRPDEGSTRIADSGTERRKEGAS